jgi:hypothetical protein
MSTHTQTESSDGDPKPPPVLSVQRLRLSLLARPPTSPFLPHDLRAKPGKLPLQLYLLRVYLEKVSRRL